MSVITLYHQFTREYNFISGIHFVFILYSLDICRTRKIPLHKLCKEYVKVSWRCMTDIFDAYEYVIKWNKKIKPCVRVRINGK